MRDKVYTVAISQKEADAIASEGHWFKTKASAEELLKHIRQPPTDPYYGNQYKVYTVRMVKNDCDTKV